MPGSEMKTSKGEPTSISTSPSGASTTWPDIVSFTRASFSASQYSQMKLLRRSGTSQGLAYLRGIWFLRRAYSRAFSEARALSLSSRRSRRGPRWA